MSKTQNPSEKRDSKSALGTVGGVAAGAAVGSLLSPLGAAVGAVVGGVVGSEASKGNITKMKQKLLGARPTKKSKSNSSSLSPGTESRRKVLAKASSKKKSLSKRKK